MNPPSEALDFTRLKAAHAPRLANFFEDLVSAGVNNFFHPHPFDAVTADRVANYPDRDMFFGGFVGDELAAYGLLRGWDEGYAVPSLGLAVHPRCQGQGIGRTMMHYLHAAAAQRGAQKIRLSVHPENESALKLYQSLGYVFQAEKPDRLVGMIELRQLQS